MKRKWMDQAECLDPGVHIEFLALPEDVQLDICAGCPVIAECREYGQDAGLDGVVYAGIPTSKGARSGRGRRPRGLAFRYSGYGI